MTACDISDEVPAKARFDKTWRIATGAPAGPFQSYDVVGLATAYNISASGGARQQAFAKYLKDNYIDKGNAGGATSEGFYSSPAH